MTQSTLNGNVHPLVNSTPAYKVGETGDTIVYIFPSGNACVNKGKKTASQPKKTLNINRTAAKVSKPSDSPPKAIGDRLVQAGIITTNQLQVALYDQQHMNLELGEVLLARGWIEEGTLDGLQSA